MNVALGIVFSAWIATPFPQQRPAPDEADQPVRTTIQNPDAVAVVIGVTDYEHSDIPDVQFAGNDAEAVRRVLTQTLGYSQSRVLFRSNAQASIGRLKPTIRRDLAALVIPERSDVFVYFSGHGAPNVDTKEGYVIPWDYDPQYSPSTDTAYSLRELYADLARLKARSVTVMLEACFSGQSDQGSLMKDASPLMIVVDRPVQELPNSVVIAASGASEIATWYRERNHGLMTYFWLRAMRGEAADSEGRVSASGLEQYLREHVPPMAQQLRNRNQVPQVISTRADSLLAQLPLSAIRTGAARILEAYGSLRISIDVGGDLYIDGTRQGTIPAGRIFEQERITAGPHLIEIRKEGYETIHEELIVEADQQTRQTYRFRTVPAASKTPPPLGAIASSNRTGNAAVRDSATGIEFVRIVPGDFMMGCSANDTQCYNDEKPAHLVRLSNEFEIAKYEVTQAQWQSVMSDNPNAFKAADRPIDNVSWNDVQEFLQRLNARQDGYRYRLPTEAEWEYAARAGSTGIYAGSLDRMGWHSQNGEGQTHPVGQKQPNAWGLYDMHGNVWEWVQDWYNDSYYGSSPAADPVGPPTGQSRVMRGGSWMYVARYASASARFRYGPDDKSNDLGFRCVREAIR